MSCLLCFHRCVEIFFPMDALLHSFVSASRLGFEWGGSVLGSPQKGCWGLHRGSWWPCLAGCCCLGREIQSLWWWDALDPSQVEGADRVGGEGQCALRKMVWTEALMCFVGALVSDPLLCPFIMLLLSSI